MQSQFAAMNRLRGHWGVSRRGLALPMVLMVTMAFLVMLTGLFFRTSQQKRVQPYVYEQTKALFLAKGINQLALYKIKVLPADLYKSKLAVIDFGTNDPYNEYISDFDSAVANSPVNVILNAIPDKAKYTFNGGIGSFSVQMKDQGFKRDLISVFSYGVCNNRQQNFEALAEMDIKIDSF
jgi:hypothetical protein